MMPKPIRTPLSMTAAAAMALAVVLSPVTAGAQTSVNAFRADPTVVKVTEGAWQISAGSNTLLVEGETGAILVDSLLFNPDKLWAAVKSTTDKPIVYLITTHAHADHTAGNALFHQRGSMLISTTAAYDRISQPSTNARGETRPPIDKVGWPTIHYDKPTDIKIDGVTARFIPVQPSHQDGDAMVFFPIQNILVMGDLHHSHEYPVYDAQTGCACGSYEGNLDVYRQALAMIDDDTKVIAGHGGVTDKAEVTKYVAMLESIRTTVQAMIDKGMTKEEVIAAKPLADDDAPQPGGPDNRDAFIGTLYTALKTGQGA